MRTFVLAGGHMGSSGVEYGIDTGSQTEVFSELDPRRAEVLRVLTPFVFFDSANPFKEGGDTGMPPDRSIDPQEFAVGLLRGSSANLLLMGERNMIERATPLERSTRVNGLHKRGVFARVDLPGEEHTIHGIVKLPGFGFSMIEAWTEGGYYQSHVASLPKIPGADFVLLLGVRAVENDQERYIGGFRVRNTKSY